MNKKLITLAVAAAMAAPAVALADATIYGKLHLSIDYVDMDDFANYPGYLPAGHSSADPVAASLGYTDALANGTYLPDGTMVTMGIPEFTTEFDKVYMEQIDAGVPSEIAEVEATRAAIFQAQANGTSEQLLAAVAQAAFRGRGPGYNGWDVTSVPGASRFGIKGSEDLGGGLKAIYQLEFGVDPADGNLSTSLRNSFVGLAGGFGTFLVGRHDTPLKISTGRLDMFADSMADYNYTVGFDDVRASNVVAYISPNFSGFTFAGAVVAPGTEGRYNDIYNYNVPVDNFGDGLAEAWSVAAMYSNGPFFASVAYENLGSKLWNGFNNLYQPLYGTTADDDTKWRVGLGLLDWNGFTLSGVYEDRSNVLGAPDNSDAKLWQIQTAYAFGNNKVKAMYGQMDLDSCADPAGAGFNLTCQWGLGLVENQDKETWAIGFDHNFSKRTTAYALYTALSDDIDNADWSGFSLGMIHKF